MKKMMLALLLGALGASVAQADRGEGRLLQATLPTAPGYDTWQRECGSCHVTYPPILLPASSWRAMMGGLMSHFGTDASLTAEEQEAITALLAGHAGSPKVDPAEPLRITRAPWFLREHREVRPLAWKRPAVKSPANCQACHGQAEKGDYSERHIRIPR